MRNADWRGSRIVPGAPTDMQTSCPSSSKRPSSPPSREKPNWGARKIRERLLRRLPSEVKVPARSTIHAILDRHGLVAHARRSRTRTEGTLLSEGASPNALWCADYKGEFMLADRRYCYPLTVTDHASRYLLLCEAMESNAEKTAFTAFERLF